MLPTVDDYTFPLPTAPSVFVASLPLIPGIIYINPSKTPKN